MAYRRTSYVEEQLAHRRVAIVTAARRLVGEVGFQAAQVAAIASVAGVAVGTVYRYFPSKAELFAEVVATTCQREVGVCAAVARSDGPPAERLGDTIAVFARRALQGRRIAYALTAEPVDPAVEVVRLHYREALGEVLETLITEGIASGDFPEQDAATSAACLVGAVIEGLVGPLAPEGRGLEDGGKTVVATIERFCLRAVAGQSQAAGSLEGAGRATG